MQALAQIPVRWISRAWIRAPPVPALGAAMVGFQRKVPSAEGVGRLACAVGIEREGSLQKSRSFVPRNCQWELAALPEIGLWAIGSTQACLLAGSLVRQRTPWGQVALEC